MSATATDSSTQVRVGHGLDAPGRGSTDGS